MKVWRTGATALAAACAAGLLVGPADAVSRKSPDYDLVTGSASGSYAFTEEQTYATGGGETITYTVEFSARRAKLYLAAGERYGWSAPKSTKVTITYSVRGNIPAVSWNPCTGQTWEATGSFTGKAEVGFGGPTRDFGKGGSGRKIKLKDRKVLVAVEAYVPVTKTTNRLDDYPSCHTETETEDSSQFISIKMTGKVKGSEVTLTAVQPDSYGVDNNTRSATGDGSLRMDRNPALRW